MSDTSAEKPRLRRHGARWTQWLLVLVAVVSAAASLGSAVISYVSLNQYRQTVAFQEILSACVDADEAGLHMQSFLQRLRERERPPIDQYVEAHTQMDRATSRLNFLSPADLSLETDATVRSVTVSLAATHVLELSNADAPREEINVALSQLQSERRRMDDICRGLLGPRIVFEIDGTRHTFRQPLPAN